MGPIPGRLSEALRDFLGRVEILALGAESHRLRAMEALGQGLYQQARTEALALLDELPRSRAGLALLADATEALLLDDEAVEALERLAAEVPFRADVWLRLAAALRRTGRDDRSALQRAAEAGAPLAAADQARLNLADRDLHAGDIARAERWLEQLSFAARNEPQAVLRRAEAALDRGDAELARRLAEALPVPNALDGRGWLLRGRLGELDADPSAAFAFERALLLDAPRAVPFARAFVARCTDPAALGRLREAVQHLGDVDAPGWRSAFAMAEHRNDEALAALGEAARTGAPGEILAYLQTAVRERSSPALRSALEYARGAGLPVHPGLDALVAACDASDEAERIAHLEAATGPASDWAEALRRETFRRCCPEAAPTDWPIVLATLERLARMLGALDALRELEVIARDLERPVRVAVIGEFNAGKSSFINALLGGEVVPVGVLPTTATLNWLAWAPDRFARIVLGGRDDRIVTHRELEATLEQVGTSSVQRVLLYAPLEPLRRIELIDTPGFNAPESAHAVTALGALEEAHIALFLLDATQPLKASERAVLEEVRRRGLPLLVLVNKSDRLDPEGTARVLAHVTQGLDEVGVEPVALPVAFSAKGALGAGQSARGAATASETREQSGWSDVERLLESAIVAKSEWLRDLALRRRAARTATRLATLADERSAHELARARGRQERRDAIRRAADRLREEPEALEERLATLSRDKRQTLNEDLAPVLGAERDPGAQRFMVDRARVVMGAPLARAALESAALDGTDDSDVYPEVSAALAASVGAAELVLRAGRLGPQGQRAADEAVARALVAEVINAAERLSRPEPAPESPAGGWHETARILAETLDGTSRSGC